MDWTAEERGRYGWSCSARGSGFYCARIEGHAPPHAAGTGTDVIHTWVEDKEEEN